MPNIFEELMTHNGQLTTEGITRSRQSVKESKTKIPTSKIKLESRRIFEETEGDDLETQFNVDPEDSADDEVVLVVDPELPEDEEVPEDAAQNMVGDSVYKCPVCGANYVCDCETAQNEGIELNADGTPMECPICGDDSDQILIGEIAPAEGAGEETDIDSVDPDGGEDNSDDVTDDIEDEVVDDVDDDFSAEDEDDFDGEESLHEGIEDQIPEEIPDDETVCDEGDCGLELAAADVASETPPVVINAETVDLDIDESRLESLMNTMLRENYKGNPSFKVTRASRKKGTLKLEYIVRTQKGKSKGTLVAEGFTGESRKMTIKFRDKGVFTEGVTRKPAFVFECVRIRNQIIPSSLSYDFKKKINESVYRVHGESRASKKNNK